MLNRICDGRADLIFEHLNQGGSADALVNAGTKLDARDAFGDTPLSWASWHLRPAEILRLFCHGPHRVHPNNDSTYDHGQGWQLRER